MEAIDIKAGINNLRVAPSGQTLFWPTQGTYYSVLVERRCRLFVWVR